MKTLFVILSIIALIMGLVTYQGIMTIKSTQTTEPKIDDSPIPTNNDGIKECPPKKDPAIDDSLCIEIYEPVCAKVNIQCVTTSCEPIKQTYANSCKACQNPLVREYEEGEC